MIPIPQCADASARAGAAVAMLLLIGQVQATGECDLRNGEKLFQKCAVCHSLETGAPHGVGPNLNGVIGRAVGQVEGFKFSRRMRESSKTWTAEHLDLFLENPMGVYERTRMAFSGLKKTKDRADVMCFIRHASEGDAP